MKLTARDLMNTLSVYRFGAILVRDREGAPCGVISKSDAARIRSGSCQACMSSRIQLET